MIVQATPLALPAVGVFVWLFILAVAQADPPPGYYDAVDDTDATTLRATLHEVIDDHTRFPYTSDSTDTWDILNEAQEDPASAANILDVYANRSLLKISGGVGQYNREHSWPKSYGFPNDTTSNYPYTDCHQLFLCDANYNSDRSNLPFRFCDAGCSERTTDANNGQGGGAGTYPGNSNWFSGSFVSGTWETWIGMRGDIARAQFYLDVRYEGGTHGVSGFAEPDLILTDNQALIAASQTGSNEPGGQINIWHDARPFQKHPIWQSPRSKSSRQFDP
ncbi:MAG: endonuclease [Planctomycetes bacterium]|nr:endonuclease [Planctomycetota bacterium]